MAITLLYLDTCLPDYFQGFGGDVYAVPLSAKPRKGEVLRGLLAEIHSVELFVDGESVHVSVYNELEKQAHALFEGHDKRKAWIKSCDDLSESYAYFGVKFEDE